MKQPFELKHIREFGDGSCMCEAINLRPGLTTGDLIDYVLCERKQDVGSIHPASPGYGARVKYERGHLTNQFILQNLPIKRLRVYGGYHRWDYIYEV